MDQDFGAQYSSACESDWTFYLGHSLYHYEKTKNVVDFYDGDDEDDDNLSMVSDASSGPPAHVGHQEQESNEWKKEEKNVKKATKVQDLPCYFDHDNSTSSFFNFSHVGDNEDLVEGGNVIIDYSKESKSRLQDEYGLFESSVSATQCDKTSYTRALKYEEQ